MPNRRQKHNRTDWLVPKGTKAGSKGKLMRRVIAKHVEAGREYYLHATKGYRSRRA